LPHYTYAPRAAYKSHIENKLGKLLPFSYINGFHSSKKVGIEYSTTITLLKLDLVSDSTFGEAKIGQLSLALVFTFRNPTADPSQPSSWEILRTSAGPDKPYRNSKGRLRGK
jgi:hypothetical protein